MRAFTRHGMVSRRTGLLWLLLPLAVLVAFGPAALALLAPVLLLALAVASGLYPGERALNVLRERNAWVDARPRRARSIRRRREVRVSAAGITLAFGLAIRPPPGASVAA